MQLIVPMYKFVSQFVNLPFMPYRRDCCEQSYSSPLNNSDKLLRTVDSSAHLFHFFPQNR